MPSSSENARQFLRGLDEAGMLGHLSAPPTIDEVAARVGTATRVDRHAIERRWGLLGASADARDQLLDEQTAASAEAYSSNIENFIGTVKLPIGLAGPLRVNGLHAQRDYYVPLATSEAALVASYTRGAQIITEAGGCTAAVINTGVGRSPVFVFDSMQQSGQFILWVTQQIDSFKTIADATTRYGKLRDVKITMAANLVFLLLEYTTGDAAGQNMVTIATEAVCRYIEASSPVTPKQWFVEGNMSGDKKASSQSFQSVRGRKVTAEVVLPSELVRRRLRVEPQRMVDYYRVSSLGGVMSGNIGIQGHYANGLAALFIATGQDAACVAEAAVGITRMDVREDGALQASVTLPNLIVGTVGGGTKLPSQAACLQLLGLCGPGHANALAEVTGALVLAGELSIIAALAAGQFARAHEKLARGKPS
ncbi:MAG TPA: hydroxymethylglutaryl-CoA reductase [Tepidisphaeraceae bacterium]|jgi:hydroxymethylglutaryl-CoA reductase (NADPH)